MARLKTLKDKKGKTLKDKGPGRTKKDRGPKGKAVEDMGKTRKKKSMKSESDDLVDKYMD